MINASGYKRRLESLTSALNCIPHMLDRAMNSGITASYVLMDSWFSHQPYIQMITEKGLDVIAMVKQLKQRYILNEKKVTLSELYQSAKPIQSEKKSI